MESYTPAEAKPACAGIKKRVLPHFAMLRPREMFPRKSRHSRDLDGIVE
jgi:hypothetical protein